MNSIDKLLEINVYCLSERVESTVAIKLKKLNNEEFEFPIVSLTNSEFNEFVEGAVEITTNSAGKTESKAHMYKLNKNICIAGCGIFKDKKYRDHFNVRTADQMIDALMTDSEVEKLSDAIVALGNNRIVTVNEIKEELKN